MAYLGEHMKFPLQKNELDNNSLQCTWCNCDKVSEPNSMAMLACGAVLMNRKTGDGIPDNRLDGFLDLTWHGAHTCDGGYGEHPDTFVNIMIAENVQGGQISISFCSTKCLREFLNFMVDKLEDKIIEQEVFRDAPC